VEVRFEQVTKTFDQNQVLAELDLSIPDGDFLVLLGPSGCGKTTALRIAAGLETPTGGRFFIGDRDVTALPPRARDIAMVFQSYALYPHLKVRDNIGYPLRIRKQPKDQIRSEVERVAGALGLENHLDRKPRHLSGGQRQRVALARAIIRNPSAFLMDEPLSNLDAQLRVQMRLEIKRLQQDLGTTTLYVTHDQVEAMTMADRIAVLKDGLLQQLAPPLELYSRPANTFVAKFVGSPPMNILAGTVSDGEFRCDAGTLPAPADAPRGEVLAGFRPESATLTDPGASAAQLQLPVFAVEPLGNEMIVAFRVGDEFLNVRVPAGAPVTVGQNCGIQVAAGHLHFFNSQSGLRESHAPAPQAEIPASPLKETLWPQQAVPQRRGHAARCSRAPVRARLP
jgi:multiple sugar transport system ATP-binding protein